MMSSKPFKITADDSRCASDYQVGGAHYRTENGSVDHWTYCDANDVPYLESACTKYVLRWQDKNGLQDLYKARHYLQKRIEHYAEGIGAVHGGRLEIMEFIDFCVGSGLLDRSLELEIISKVMHWHSPEDLEYARLALEELIEDVASRPVGKGYVDQDREPGNHG